MRADDVAPPRATLATLDGDPDAGEDVGARQEVQRAQLRMIRHADAADAGQRLRERADDEVDLVEDALILGAAEAGGAVGAERVRLVDEQVGAVRAADVDDVAQRRDVAADGIQPFDDDQPVALAAPAAARASCAGSRRVVPEADDLRRGLPRRVVDAGVAVAVDQDDVAGAAQAADERQVRLVAGAEDDRVALRRTSRRTRARAPRESPACRSRSASRWCRCRTPATARRAAAVTSGCSVRPR